jgi:hypothetical protein
MERFGLMMIPPTSTSIADQRDHCLPDRRRPRLPDPVQDRLAPLNLMVVIDVVDSILVHAMLLDRQHSMKTIVVDVDDDWAAYSIELAGHSLMLFPFLGDVPLHRAAAAEEETSWAWERPALIDGRRETFQGYLVSDDHFPSESFPSLPCCSCTPS